MAQIEVLKGVRYRPEMLIKRMSRSKNMENIQCRHVSTLYSLCWVFQFRIGLQASKRTRRYAGYYAGFDESVMSPGKIAMLPTAELQQVEDCCVIEDKLSEEEALARAWEYNKRGILRKFRNLYAPPELEEYVADRYYKPMYVFEFHNLELDERKYMTLDSLTGDLEEIVLR